MSSAAMRYSNQEWMLKLDTLQATRVNARQSQSLAFLEIPPEIRQRVYIHHLFFAERVKLVSPLQNESFAHHIKECRTTDHEVLYHPEEGGQILICNQPWGKKETRPPSSVLDLLLTSRLIYNEAVDLFYDINRFAFNDAHDIASFAKQVGKRFLQMRDISFPFNRSPAAFNQLRRCENLTTISIHFPAFEWGTAWSNKEASLLRGISGMDELMKLRNFKDVRISGYDVIFDSTSNEWMLVDVSHPRSIGEDFVSNLMTVS